MALREGELKNLVVFTTKTGGGGTMGCHPRLTKNAKYLTNVLRGDLSTVNVRN